MVINMRVKSCAVLGLGKFGMSLAKELAKAGAEGMTVGIDEEKVHAGAEFSTCSVKADVRDTEDVESLGLSNMDIVVVAITSNMDASILATILAKEEGVPFVLAKADGEIHAKILQKVGADRIVVPEKEYGIRMARNLLSGNFMDFIELSENVSMIEMPAKEEWQGKSLIELDLRKKYKANVIAIRSGEEVISNPEPNMPLQKGMSLLLIVEKQFVSKLA